jgi:hypothetical protein
LARATPRIWPHLKALLTNEAAGRIRDMAIERVGAAILDHQADELLPVEKGV